MSTEHNTLIFGHGACARQVAEALNAKGFRVAMINADVPGGDPGAAAGAQKPITPWAGARLIDCQGQAGNFQVTLDQEGRRTICRAGSIVVAEQEHHAPNFAAYGLRTSNRVISISTAEAALGPEGWVAPAQGPTRVLFLNDWTQDCHPETAARMLRLCLALQQQPDRRTVYMTGQLKVSVDGMEVCCQAAKAAGTVFFKVDREFPKLETIEDGRVRVSCWDDTTRLAFGMTFDYVVVDEKIAPNPYLAHLARVLRLDRDAAGFVQSDNVHRLSNATNRRGVFAAGGARAILSPEARQADAGHVALKVAEFLADLDRVLPARVEIDTGRCARCLTCYRLCPHAAIAMTPRMTIVSEACQSCGLCAAGCPNRAIQVHDDELGAALARLMPVEASRLPSDPGVPRLVAFCCRRSAVQAREMSVAMGQHLPSGLVVVEGICGGSFSVRHLLRALEAGADGVMVLTCHEGNCHSENGPRNAAQRVAATVHTLADIAAERIHFSTLAANMGADFARRVNQFAGKIAALGPALENNTVRRARGRHTPWEEKQ